MNAHHRRNWQILLDALAETLAEVGGEGWLVGGCLRDAALGEPAGDVDVALTSEPLPLAERLAAQQPLAIGRLGHGTVRLTSRAYPDITLDLTRLHGASIASDLAARDFTVNAMALPLDARAEWLALSSGHRGVPPDLLDPFGGRAHLLARRLVVVGSNIFRADPGRIIRAARLRARFGLRPDAETLRLAREAVPLLATLSFDRLHGEMTPLLALHTATDGVALLADLGVLPTLYRDLTGDATIHALATLRALDRLMGVTDTSGEYPALQAWSASDTRRIAQRRMALYHADDEHERQPELSTLWQRELTTLRIMDETERLYHARLLFDGLGKDEVGAADRLLVACACALALGGADAETLAARADALVAVYLSDREQLIPLRLLTGKDLITSLGVLPGPNLGRLLHMVRLAQLMGEISERDEALALARSLKGA
jgi:tRNA nucleotidyltransferase/poly(A) polymerase